MSATAYKAEKCVIPRLQALVHYTGNAVNLEILRIQGSAPADEHMSLVPGL